MNSRALSLSVVIATLLLAVSFSGSAQTQSQQPADDPAASAQAPSTDNNTVAVRPISNDDAVSTSIDPPSRVARLSYTRGAVSYQPGGQGDWLTADSNRPLTTGDNLWSDADSLADVHIGSASIRLSSLTGISLIKLTDRAAQIQLAAGTIQVRIRRLTPGDAWQFDTTNLSFAVTQPGEFLIRTDTASNLTEITVRDGAGEVTGGSNQTYDLAPDRRYVITGTSQLTFQDFDAPPPSDFETWSGQRDTQEDNSPSAKYVSPEVDGYDDLDDAGNWENTGDYGNVWYPSGVAAGWVPYRSGHWLWVRPWGWTWREDEPWGFAPFHYGRWIYSADRWGWVPGPASVRPVYAPALVAFVGGAGAFSYSVSLAGGFNGVAWFPLGPRDVFIPAFRASTRFVQRVNLADARALDRNTVLKTYHDYNTTHIVSGTYMHQNNVAAVTAVSRDAFVNGGPVARENVRLTADQLRDVRVDASRPIGPVHGGVAVASAQSTAHPVAHPRTPFEPHRPAVARLNPAPAVVRNSSSSAPQGTSSSQSAASAREHRVFTNDSPMFDHPRPPEDESAAHGNGKTSGNNARQTQRGTATGAQGGNTANPPSQRAGFTPPQHRTDGDNRSQSNPPQRTQTASQPRPAPQPQHQAQSQPQPSHQEPPPPPPAKH